MFKINPVVLSDIETISDNETISESESYKSLDEQVYFYFFYLFIF